MQEFINAFRTCPGAKDNLVKLVDLRSALPYSSRKEQDLTIQFMRVSGLFTLTGPEGTMTPAEREAGVEEFGEVLIYVSERI